MATPKEKIAKLVQFEVGVAPFITTKEVTNELVLEHINKDRGCAYPNLRIENDKIIYDDHDYGFCSTERIRVFVKEHKFM